MRFGTIGAGTIAQALAHHVITAGYPVTLAGGQLMQIGGGSLSALHVLKQD